MSTTADRTSMTVPAMLVGECVTLNRHLMVAVTVDPAEATALRTAVVEVLEGDGLWCGPGAASRRCRRRLLDLVVAGGVSAAVVDGADYDNPGKARAACLLAVAGLADTAGVDRVVLARDDTRAAADSEGSVELAHRAGASPVLRCEHNDAAGEPLTVLAELLVWSWAQGGDVRRSVGRALSAVHLV